MRIRVSDIGADGLEVRGTISLESLNQRMNEGSTNDISFLRDPRVDIKVHRTISGVCTSGKVRTRYKQPCALCVDELEKDLEIEANFVFQHRSLDETTQYHGETDSYFDDIGVNFYTGDHIDLEDLIQESLILSLTPYLRPPRLADGTCSVCNKKPELCKRKEENSTFTLAQLLRNAGVR